jgi:hypothetical protein
LDGSEAEESSDLLRFFELFENLALSSSLAAGSVVASSR